ncbi:hypothetical protein ABPG77_000116 [Micractinium sp. CCAP 211/92]
MGDIDNTQGSSPEQPGGIPQGLAELAGLRLVEDWASLPHSLLGIVFRRLLEQLVTVEEIVRAWQALALVCQSWQAALRASTPLCLELSKPAHLSAAARRWLSRVPMEVVVLARTLSFPAGADCQLLAAEGFQQHSASVLRSLMHVSPDAAPLLHSFSKLKQVAIYCSDPSDRARRIDAAVFHQLPKLNCLTIAGYWGVFETDQLPSRLKHLALSNYNEHYSLEVTLPPSLKQLELLSLRSAGVVLDWMDACARCQEIHVAAEAAVLGVGSEPVQALIREVGLTNLQQHMYKQVGAAMRDGEHFQEATLAFFNLMLFSGPLDRGVMPIDADDFLQTLRDDLLPVGIDVNPALEVHPEFVTDVPSQEACFVLELVKQEAGKPKSLHFTTPVTDAEVRLLTSQPVWRISWCDDPRAHQLLSDPAFIAQSRDTLTDLLSIPLVPELDLRPFRKLLSVLGTLRCDAAALPAVLRRMPRSLESLCITAEGSPEPRDFDAGLVRHLRALREVSLYGHRRHDLAGLRRGVNMVRILNPIVARGEVIGTGANYCWPDLGSQAGEEEEGSSSRGDDSEWEEEGAAKLHADSASAASADSFDSADSVLRGGGGGSGSGSPPAAGGAAAAWTDSKVEPTAAAGTTAAPAAGMQQQEQQQQGEPAGSPGSGASAAAGIAAAAVEEPDAHAAAADDDDASSSSGSSSGSETYVDAEHGGHGHKHGGAEEERHSKQSCLDPFCPCTPARPSCRSR